MTPEPAWRRLRRDRVALACAAYLALIVLFCVAGPPLAAALAGLDATTQDHALGAAPPSWQHPFGTDALGRDVLVRVMVGGRLALLVAAVATLVAVAVGVTWGAIAGYAGGPVDFVMMRIVDVLYGLPVLIVVLVAMAVLGNGSLVLLLLLIGAIQWMTIARIVRAEVRSLRQRDFTVAARALGAGARRIVARHLVPNSLGPVVVYATLQIPEILLTEAFLSFLGLGVPPPGASWGTLVADGADKMRLFPWLLAAPAAVMTTTLVAINLLGDRVRAAARL